MEVRPLMKVESVTLSEITDTQKKIIASNKHCLTLDEQTLEAQTRQCQPTD